MFVSGQVNWNDFDLEFEGEYEKPVPAVWREFGESTPSEGGYFDEISIFLEGKDITTILSTRQLDEIEKLAEELI